MKLKILVSIALLAAGFLLGWFLSPRETAEPAAPTTTADAPAEPEIWTCPMHPEVEMPRRGKCPKCGMDLVLREQSDDGRPRVLTMSEEDKKLAEIVTARVERRYVTNQVRLVGKVDYDETRIKTISAWIPSGRLERMFVDYTGVPINEGDHLVLIYSPELLTAQEELLKAKRSVDSAHRQPSEFLRDSDRRALESAREKLRLWGLTLEQITAIEERGTAEDQVLITSPSTGIVIHKGLNQGDYVQTGTPIYRIADVNHLWVRLHAYESDLPWIRYGQEVLIETEAYAGESFRGWISFIAWEVDERTRTVDVRVNVENRELKLKPGMFVRASVQARIAAGGAVMDPRLAGKWVCPMHPEVVADGVGVCTVCGMPLVAAKTLMQVADQREPPLVVPATAVLVTGKRGVVYVEVPDQDKPTFEGREVVLGPRAGDYYIILAGLRENERVVVNGNFKIDSALQLRAKPSMLSMGSNPGPLQGRRLGAFRGSLAPIYDAYLAAHDALARDDETPAREAIAQIVAVVPELHPGDLPRDAHEAWHELANDLHGAAQRAVDGEDLGEVRRAFESLSRAMIHLEQTFGHAGATAHSEVFCPMAFDGKGAPWLQIAGPVRNPYYGSKMLGCGDVSAQHPGRGGRREAEAETPRPPEDRNVPPDDRVLPPPTPADQPATDPAQAPPAAASFAAALGPVYAAYLDLQAALASDLLEPSTAAFTALGNDVGSVDMGLVKGEEHHAWMQLAKELAEAARAGADSEDLETVRIAFRRASTAILELEQHFGHAGEETWFEAFCPMAFGDGAPWIQRGETIRNPYYGAGMLRCGEIRNEHAPKQGR